MAYSEETVELSGKKVFFRKLVEDTHRKRILMLHGMSFTSEDWLKLDAFRKISQWGFDVFAVDFPGFGKSEQNSEYGISSGNYENASKFVKDFSAEIGLKGFCIVGPSMGGAIAIRSAIDLPDLINSVIIIGGAGVDAFERELSKIEMPVLIIWGSKDRVIDISKGRKYHDLISGSKMQTIDGAGHAAYLDKPAQFFNMIKEFLENE